MLVGCVEMQVRVLVDSTRSEVLQENLQLVTRKWMAFACSSAQSILPGGCSTLNNLGLLCG